MVATLTEYNRIGIIDISFTHGKSIVYLDSQNYKLRVCFSWYDSACELEIQNCFSGTKCKCISVENNYRHMTGMKSKGCSSIAVSSCYNRTSSVGTAIPLTLLRHS